MKLKQHWTFLLITLSAIVILLSGCEKKEAVDLYTRHVEVVFSPNGIGDQGYNDNILAGLQQASIKYGFVLAIHMPQEKEQAKDIYEEWLHRQLEDNCNRALFVFAGSEYEYLLDSISLPEDERKDIIMFETDKEVEGVYTFNVGTYAASYLAGAISVLDTQGEEQKALVIAANPYDKNVKRSVDGYRDGYLAAGGNGCDVLYLSNHLDGGYNMQDSAYIACMERRGEYMFYFPVAGLSNKGVYRYSREYLDLVVGMDRDMSAYASMMFFSVAKHMDRAVADIIGALIKNWYVPFHQKFTYSSGYEELVFSTIVTESSFLDISEFKKRIIEIEQAYEEANQ